jgi:hypothetical protein
MKRKFLLFGLVVLSFSVFSQVVIEEADLMQPGDTFLIHVDLNPTLSVDLTPGTNLTWDITGLQNDQSNFACYAPSDDLEFIGEFPLSEFYTYGPGFIYAGPGGGAPLDNWGYMMFFTNSNGLFVEGFYSDYGMGYRSTMNTPAELLMFTPANYLDEEVNDSYWEVVVNENIVDYDTLYRRDVDKELVADAWGTLTTDYGTYEVLRIHETGISVDSVFGYVGSITFFTMEVARDTINNYYFWAKELRNPLMTLHCDYDGNIERIDYMMGAIYAENKLPINDDFNIFPNPASDFFVINNAIGEIQILSIEGKLIKEFVSNGNQEVISTDSFEPGVYFIILNRETKGKLIVY